MPGQVMTLSRSAGRREGWDAVGGRRHVGIAGGRRRAGAPRGTTGDLGSMAIAPHRARRGPRTMTGTAVTVSGVGGLCPRDCEFSVEMDHDLWILFLGPSARERSPGLSLSHLPHSLSVERMETESSCDSHLSHSSRWTAAGRSGVFGR